MSTYSNSLRRCLGIVLALLWCAQASATLFIVVYDDNRIFIGTDSRAHDMEGNKNYVVQKTFRLSDTCLVSVGGYYGGRYEQSNVKEGDRIVTQLPALLETLCGNSTPRETIVTEMHKFYTSFPASKAKTWVMFTGYDQTNAVFFNVAYTFNGTNAIGVQRYDYSASKVSQWSPICFFEEAGTNTTMLLPDLVYPLYSSQAPSEKLAPLASAKFREAVRKMSLRQPLSDSEVASFLLECFRIDVGNAERLGYGLGHTGPPFNIYKVTTNAAVQLPSGM